MKTDDVRIPPEYMKAVIGKLQSLEPSQVYVVSNLIDFLRDQREEEEDIHRWASLAAQSAFRGMDNAENGSA